MMDWGNNGWGAGDWVAMSAMILVFWGGLVALVVWVVRSARPGRSQEPVDSAEALLAARFARGDIDGEEFTRSRELLQSGGSSPS
jgi:putative membrane protein